MPGADAVQTGFFAVPTLQDNYTWIVPTQDGAALVVDPGEAAPVQAALARRGLRLGAILATHHHHDHVGGVAQLLAQAPDVPVLAGQHDAERCRVPRLTRAVADGETLTLLGQKAHVLAVPGHTLGAVAYHMPDLAAVFTGDTLFLAGCGRLFEGDAATMWRSLAQLRALPEQTKVCCGHNYLAKNLRFAGTVLSAADLADAAAGPWATLAHERRRNPFLRADDALVQRRLATRGAEATFAELRRRRDAFR